MYLDSFDKEIIRRIGKRWKWIAREKDGTLSLFVEKPYKTNNEWWVNISTDNRIDVWSSLGGLKRSVLSSITWYDDEPVSLDEIRQKIMLYKCDFCGNEVEPAHLFHRYYCPICGRLIKKEDKYERY